MTSYSSIHPYIEFFSAIITLGLALYVIARNPEDRLSRAFSLFTFILGLASLFEYVFTVASPMNRPLVWFFHSLKVSTFSFGFSAALYFGLVFAEKYRLLRRPSTHLLLWLPPLVVTYLLFYTDYAIRDIVHQPWGNEKISAPGYSIVLVQVILFIFATLCIVFVHSIRSRNPILMKRGLLIVGAGLIPAVTGVMTSAFLPFLGIALPPLASASTAVFCLLTYYSIRRYSLFAVTPARAVDAILATTSGSVLAVDLESKISFANHSACELFGESEEAVRAALLSDFFEEKDCQMIREQLLMDGRSIAGHESWIRTFHGGSRQVILNGTILKDPFGVKLGAVIDLEDITKRKKAEAALKEYARRTEEANRKKTEFVSDVSHELRTPLASIKGFTSTILSDKEMDPHIRQDFLMTVDDEADRLTRLLNGLLDLSRIESGRIKLKKENIRLTDLIKKNVETIRNQAEEKCLALKMQLPEKCPYVYADSDKISQIIINLLSNAIKYTKEGEVSILARPDNGYVLMEVVDTGIGIAKEDIPKVFDKFQRFETPGIEARGTGLGLSIVKAMIELHGGEVFAESELGKGSKFAFRLPMVKEGEVKT